MGRREGQREWMEAWKDEGAKIEGSLPLSIHASSLLYPSPENSDQHSVAKPIGAREPAGLV